jgi:putative protease
MIREDLRRIQRGQRAVRIVLASTRYLGDSMGRLGHSTQEVAMAEEVEVGQVMHYFGKINVAAIELTGDLKVGDTIRIKGHTSDFTQTVDSMQIDRDKVDHAAAGAQIGIEVIEHARPGDTVFRVS